MVSSLSLVVCRRTWGYPQGTRHHYQVSTVADWLTDDEAEPASAVAASVGRKLNDVTCQSLADAPPSNAVLSVHQHIVSVVNKY